MRPAPPAEVPRQRSDLAVGDEEGAAMCWLAHEVDAVLQADVEMGAVDLLGCGLARALPFVMADFPVAVGVEARQQGRLVELPFRQQGGEIGFLVEHGVGAAEGDVLADDVDRFALNQRPLSLAVAAGVGYLLARGEDLRALGVDQHQAAAVVHAEGVVRNAGFDVFPAVAVPALDAVAVPQAGQAADRADQPLSRWLPAASDEFDITLRRRGDARGGRVGDGAMALEVGIPGPEAGQRDQREGDLPAASRLQLEAEQQDQQIAAAQREVGVVVPPFGGSAGAEHQLPKSCFRSTSFFSSAAKRSSGNWRKPNSRAMTVSGNCSTRTLLMLTDSL